MIWKKYHFDLSVASFGSLELNHQGFHLWQPSNREEPGEVVLSSEWNASWPPPSWGVFSMSRTGGRPWSTLKCSHLSNVLVTPHSARGGSRHLPFHVTRGQGECQAHPQVKNTLSGIDYETLFDMKKRHDTIYTIAAQLHNLQPAGLSFWLCGEPKQPAPQLDRSPCTAQTKVSNSTQVRGSHTAHFERMSFLSS